ncbi:hypothetical protein EGK75_13355 [Neisseria weixii]|uniref:ORF6C domain-containing protein n=2 Tax=Neisseria weixii TaxID=1853276 RepID=A0A3N4MHF2_9NEIS|nr:hypothetical protein EGK74_13545 [Neisseria weixii]RPD83338.1 hypothetical protein EGK75_13355 [Neisseria weixii]
MIQEAVNQAVRRSGITHQGVYRALKARFGIPRYNELAAADFEAAVEFLNGFAALPAEPKPEYINGHRVKYSSNINFKQFDDKPEAYLITMQQGKVISCQSFRPTSAKLELA